jgi:hypothetical protein
MAGAERSVEMVFAGGDPAAAMKTMRRARRRRYVARADVMEVLYRVYLGALAALFGLAFLAGALHEVPADPASVEGIRAHAPAVIGIAVALLIFAALRSGARGGPLAIEAAEVRYTLLAPVSRRTALRPAALQQLRVSVVSGAIFGAVVGNFVFRRFPGTGVEWIGSLAAFGALVPIVVLGAAQVGSGRRLRPALAGGVGVVLVAWSVLDLALGWNSAPTTMLGDLATLPLQRGADAALSAVGAAVALAALAAGLLGIGGIALEAARRRAELVAEMRFSASVQDLRTVILLRRQLASEHPRRRPWIRLGGGKPASPWPVWRRDWQSVMRWPLVRIGRVVLIAAAAGGIAVAGFSQTPVLFVLPGPLLFIAALDLIEPFAQEVEHPSRRLLLPLTSAVLWRRHLVAPVVGATVVVAIAALAAAAIGEDPGLALGIGAVSVIPVALVLACAAAVSASNDPYEFILIPQLNMTVNAAPIAISIIAAFLPLFIAWKVEGGDGARVGGAGAVIPVGVAFALIGLGVLEWRAGKREREAM